MRRKGARYTRAYTKNCEWKAKKPRMSKKKI